MLKRFFRDESAATLIEYAIIAGFISIAAYTVIVSIGKDVNDKFQSTADGFK